MSDYDYMCQAVELGRLCRDERPDRPSPRVGVVVVREGEVLATAYRGQFGPGDHAEFCALEKQSPEVNLSGATVYTTLEPCTSRNHPKVPCANRLVEKGVAEVVIGMYDPDPRVNRKGWKVLRDAGIRLRDFPEDLRNQLIADNRLFLDRYRQRMIMSGTDVCFDYVQNDGRFRLGDEEHPIETRWSMAGHDSIHAFDDQNHVALARYANRFDEIDDPGALDFSSRVVTPKRGDIVVFRSAGVYALVKIGEVLAGSSYGDDHTALTFDFLIRSGSSRSTG